MVYQASAFGADCELSVEKEGLRVGKRFIDYADFASISPINHRVFVTLLSGEKVELSMLGFSFDGFWEELLDCFGRRSLESLFVDETQIMLCEGEYAIPGETGRAKIALYPDAVCILPQTSGAVRIPLCYTSEIVLDGYQLRIAMQSGVRYSVGKMGYDTTPFAERAAQAADQTKSQRRAALAKLPLEAPFTEKGLFRTKKPEQYWNAAFAGGVCALEFYTGEDAATYLYRFSEPREHFLQMLQEATEAVGVHREIIYLADEQIDAKPLYRMAVARSAAVRFLRARADGRLIHSANHAQRLQAYLQG